MEKRSLEYANGLSELIKCKTISAYNETDFKRFFDCHKVLKKLFPKVFSVCEVEVFGGSLLLKWNGKSDNLPCLFMNHHDVVDASGDWKYPPFSGEIKEGKVWGRGSLDTKGGLYCMLKGAEELMESGFVPNNDIYFESACTEEVEGSGTEIISEELYKRGIRFNYTVDEGGMVVDDPLGVSKGKYAMVGLAEKGCHVIKFTAKSNGGHASAPAKNTPLVRLGKFMAEVEKGKCFKAYLSSTTIEMLKRFSFNAKGAVKFLLKHGKFFKPLLKKVMPKLSATANALVKTTVAFTMASGSDSMNSIPNEAYVIGNMRFSHHQGSKGSLDAVEKIAKKYDVTMEVIDRGIESKRTDFKGEQFKLIERAIKKVYPNVISVPYISNTASDSRYMFKLSKNCFGFAPFKITDEQLESIHGVNENVDIECLPKAVDFYKFLMENS